MAGIYIHIPFCLTRCTYCDFYMGTNESHMETFVDALCAEAKRRKDETDEPVQTLYFGGGTPSRLEWSHFDKIFHTLFTCYSFEPDAEITLEANPDDLSEEYVRMLSTLPFNRISIGIQSFNDDELRFLSRRHTGQQAVEAVKRCQQAGFHNISIDLMYGLPGQTTEIWQKNLQQALQLQIQHISSYHLIYEEKTRMYRLLKAGKIQPVQEETSTAMFALLIDTLTSHGFIHYEISAFGLPGFFSRHNIAYWQNVKYVGLGPAAHSYDGNNRSWNVASTIRYNQSIETDRVDREMEQLSLQEKYNEFILTGLRTMWGVDLLELKRRFGESYHDYCMVNAQRFIHQKLLTTAEDHLQLTREGIFISDGIMSELMSV